MTESPPILFKNDSYVVIDKPAGWLSVPAREPKDTDQVVTHWLREVANGGSAYPIHRLDRFTSGVMLIALTEEAQSEGSRWFQDRAVKKIYHFLAAPTPSRPAIQIKTPVDGKAAQTLFEIIEKKGDFFYGRATPLTGRFHQIRDHAAEAGFPIFGDKTFGSTIKTPRICLHAFSLTTPIGEFQAPLPEDMVKVWKEIGT